MDIYDVMQTMFLSLCRVWWVVVSPQPADYGRQREVNDGAEGSSGRRGTSTGRKGFHYLG